MLFITVDEAAICISDFKVEDSDVCSGIPQQGFPTEDLQLQKKKKTYMKLWRAQNAGVREALGSPRSSFLLVINAGRAALLGRPQRWDHLPPGSFTRSIAHIDSSADQPAQRMKRDRRRMKAPRLFCAFAFRPMAGK